MTDQNAAPAAGNAGEKQMHFSLQRIYVKDISFEAPGTPQSFGGEWKPETQVQFGSSAQRLGESLYEVVLNVNVVTSNAGKVVYIAEVKQAGIFSIDAPEQALEPLLGVQCPSILFPYVQATVAGLVANGTFPQMLLQPMNFEAIYLESKRRQQQKAVPEAAAPRH